MYEAAMALIVADEAYLSIVQLQTVWAARAGAYILAPRYDEDTLAFFIQPAE
jgi:peptide/nickel transport system substrate-binding protein